MVNDDFAIFAGDPVLTTLKELSTRRLLSALQEAVPDHMLDAPMTSYGLANLRYSPCRKLVIGLTSKYSVRPIALRVFAPDKWSQKFSSAIRQFPNRVFALPDLCAIAWVFPSERKLPLGLLEDETRLKRILRERRNFDLTNMTLMHFVPEHAYTARVDGIGSGGSPVCEYIKIHYDNSGSHAASRMNQLQYQLQGIDEIRAPEDVCYVESDKLLIQSALQRDNTRNLAGEDVARVLARIHGLSIFGLHNDGDEFAARRRDTEQLVAHVFPDCCDYLRQINQRIGRALEKTTAASRVVIHGDAHLGNIFPIIGGGIGIIDFDGMRWGSAVDDLTTFYAFLIWIKLRDGESIDCLLDQLPEFLNSYNCAANNPVGESQAFAMLAQKLVADRIRRGITRGKMVGAGELTGLLGAADDCLNAAGVRHVC